MSIWTPPATATPGQLVDPAFWNAQVRDNILAIAAGNWTIVTFSGDVDPAAGTTDITAATITTHGGPVLMIRQGGQLINTTGSNQGPVYLTPYANGAVAGIGQPVVPSYYDDVLPDLVTTYLAPTMALITGLAAGTHTLSWRDNIGGAAAVWRYTGATLSIVNQVVEVGF